MPDQESSHYSGTIHCRGLMHQARYPDKSLLLDLIHQTLPPVKSLALGLTLSANRL